jgi:hypothetical protein
MQPSDPAAGVVEQARRLGPLPYSAGGPFPAPDLPPGPDLAGWLVHAVDAWWEDLGCPDPLTLVELGAGDGSRAAAFLAGGPQCLTALRYVLVEEDASLRHQHPTYLPIESPIFVLGPAAADPDDEDEDATERVGEGIGPLITSLGEAPVVDGPAVVVAIGWTSRLPSDRFEWRDGTWWEVRLAAGPAAGAVSGADELAELLVPLDDDRAAAAEVLAGGRARQDGARYAHLGAAVEWLSRTLRVAEVGRLAVIDRWSVLTGPVAPGEVPPVSLDQLAAVRRPLEPAPVQLFSGLAMLSWRLG